MNRQDYIDLGRKDGREGSPNNRLYSSWQDKAYQEGYEAGARERREQGLKMAAEAETDRLVKSDFMPYAPRALPVYDLPTAVTEHIRRLNEDAAACPDPRRKARLYNKANRLNNKWLEKASA